MWFTDRSHNGLINCDHNVRPQTPVSISDAFSLCNLRVTVMESKCNSVNYSHSDVLFSIVRCFM